MKDASTRSVKLFKSPSILLRRKNKKIFCRSFRLKKKKKIVSTCPSNYSNYQDFELSIDVSDFSHNGKENNYKIREGRGG